MSELISYGFVLLQPLYVLTQLVQPFLVTINLLAMTAAAIKYLRS